MLHKQLDVYGLHSLLCVLASPFTNQLGISALPCDMQLVIPIARRVFVSTDLCSDGTAAGTLCPAAQGSAVSSTCPELDAGSKCYAGGASLADSFKELERMNKGVNERMNEFSQEQTNLSLCTCCFVSLPLV